ncbi:MAG: glycosyltransferase [Bacteroidetes bacterium]|nr:glycosyltransferase [Bacteroidota bacterium]
MLIGETIRSILMQEGDFELEVIIGDDGATDDTPAVIEAIKRSHSKGSAIRYTRHAVNKGVNQNFLFTVEQAQGDFIAVCEGDDYWTDPFKLNKQLKLFSDNKECNYCFTAKAILKSNGELTNTKYEPALPRYFDLHYLLKRNIMPATQTIMFRRQSLDLVKFREFTNYFHGDWIILFLICENGQIGYLDEYTAVYREGIGIVSKTSGLKMFLTGLETNRKLNEVTQGKFDYHIGDYKFHYTNLTYAYLTEGQRLRGLYWFFKTLIYSIFKKKSKIDRTFVKHCIKLFFNIH